LLYTDTAGIYFYTGTLNGCSVNSDSVEIIPNAGTNFYQVLDTNICEGESLNFTLATTDAVLWFDDLTDTLSTTNSYATGSLYESTLFYYEVTASGLCPTGWIPVYVNVIETGFTPAYNGISDLCLGDSILVLANDQTALNYFWLSNGDTLSENPFIALLPDSTGNISIELVTGSYGCYSDTAFVSININELPQFDLPDDTTLCMNELLAFDSPYDYVIDYFVDADTFAVVTFTNLSGCTFTDTMLVHFIDCELFMPNIFTPDGDGVNDVLAFEIEKGIPLKLVIQNRWGQIVYESTTAEWDGINKLGEEAVAGTYFYLIEYQRVDLTFDTEQGWFFLQK
jgi:gliding motility-associated-like protein